MIYKILIKCYNTILIDLISKCKTIDLERKFFLFFKINISKHKFSASKTRQQFRNTFNKRNPNKNISISRSWPICQTKESLRYLTQLSLLKQKCALTHTTVANEKKTRKRLSESNSRPIRLNLNCFEKFARATVNITRDQWVPSF